MPGAWEGAVRKIVSWVLLMLGAFLLAAAVVATFWAGDRVERVPLDTDSTTHLTGTATVLPAGPGDYAIRATSFTRADSDASTDTVIVWENHSCLVMDIPDTPDCGDQGVGDDADPNVISISSDFFATDRNTALAVDDPDKYLPEGTAEHEGLINKFPFRTEKKDYDYWDGTVGHTVPATYEDTDEIDGLEVYRFEMSVSDEPAEIADGVEGTYSNDTTMWVEPKTGAIIDQEFHDVRAVDGEPVLDLEMSFTDDQVAEYVDDANDNIQLIDLATVIVPWVGFIGGPILLVLGFLGLRMDANRKKSAHTA
jgi:hypothetical protein